ncbi:MAG: hypothetical protein AAAFM81_00720 [Pseudomonadota bacterium]
MFGKAGRERLIWLAFGSYVAMTLAAGPARMYLSTVGLSPLIYIPNLLLIVACVWQLLAEPFEHGADAMRLMALAIIGYASVVGFLFLSPIQSIMGVYVLLPFFFGLSCGRTILSQWQKAEPWVPIAFALVAGAIIANQFVEYPWEGYAYAVGDLDVDGSRQWYANGGQKRLAGMARASFDAAAQVQLLGIVMTLQSRSILMRMAYWGITVMAIVPTNSKGILLVWLVLTPVVILQRHLSQSLIRPIPAFFGSIGLALPLSTLAFEFNSTFQNPTLASATFSFYDRLNRMWPEAWALLEESGSVLLGRGIGAIGTAQTYFEPSRFNAGDNIFMYWFVVFGALALPGFIFFLMRTLRLKPLRSQRELLLFCWVVTTLVYGAMTNIVENAILALTCGVVVRALASSEVFYQSDDRHIYGGKPHGI